MGSSTAPSAASSPLHGPDAKSFLAGQVTNDIEALKPGEGCYAAFLTHKGKMLGDMRVLAVGGDPEGARANCCSTPSAWHCRRCST